MFKKLIVGISCVAILATVSSPIVLAADASTSKTATATISEKREETEWHFKVINGAMHKRLWSLTWARWNTDWIRC